MDWIDLIVSVSIQVGREKNSADNKPNPPLISNFLFLV